MTKFNKDLFISYAHIDNEPLTSEQAGWITRFHESLEAILNMRMGGTSRIWRDDKLQGNDIFAAEIVDQFKQTALFLTVLTPRYLKSEWCTKEIAEFCNSAAQSGGLVVENKARVFKVLKTPVDTEESLPPIVKDILGYEFYTFEDGTPLELDAAYGKKFAQDYNRKVGKLAWDISQLLKTLLTDAVGNIQESQAAVKPTVYLAECSYDSKETREILEGWLGRRGYHVLPDHELPSDEDKYFEVVEQLLKRSVLSIHLVGNTYGGVPDGPTMKSYSVLQNEIAANLCKTEALKRVIWVPVGTKSEQQPQQEFIGSLHKDAGAQIGADLITGDLENLKTSIRAALNKIEKPGPKARVEDTGDVNGNRLIYLICDERDRKATIPLRKFCRSKGLNISIPAFEGDAAAIRETHEQLLTNCDGVILFYGAGDEAWKRTIDSDLQKMAAYRAGKPLMAGITYLSEPKTGDKEDLIDMEESDLIDGLGEFSDTGMAPFIEAMKPNGATS